MTTRGVERRRIAHDREDALRFVELAGSVIVRFKWLCHAFCLMPNHHHFLVEAARDNLSAGLHRLNGVYARHYNDRYGRWGHLFGDRFWSRPLQDEDEIARTAIYIVYNPVRAGLCEHPREWPWLGSRYGLDLA